jgi:hypothetical protein
MIPPDVMLQLATLGLSVDQARCVAGMLSAVEQATKGEAKTEAEAVLESGREKARARWHKWKDNQPTNVSKRLPTAANVSKQLAPDPAHVEDNLPTKNQAGKADKKKTKGNDEAEFRAELVADLSPDQLDGIIKVRRAKSGQVTRYSARLFRTDAQSCSMSVAAAADACISRNWITVKPEYFNGKHGPPNRGRRNYADVAMDRMNGHGSESIFGTHGDAQRLPAGSGESRSDDGDLRGGIARRFRPGGG